MCCNGETGAVMAEQIRCGPAANAEFVLRDAAPSDLVALAGLGTGPLGGKERFIAESLARRSVVVAAAGPAALGYIIWDRGFFGRPFVWLLGVETGHRRRGIASRLFDRFEAACAGEPLFTSTNTSNSAMQTFLARRGFAPSGCVENIDPGDPELFYFKPAETV